jgi:transcriptional regulator GlxA family with amidase domain
MKAKAAKPARRVKLAVLLTPHSSVALALLFKSVFERANRLLGRPAYEVAFVSSQASGRISIQGVQISVTRTRGSYDYLVVTPFDGFTPDQEPSAADVRLVRSQHDNGTVVASACWAHCRSPPPVYSMVVRAPHTGPGPARRAPDIQP